MFETHDNTFRKAADLTKSFEGFSPVVYKCSAGVDTFGYGFLLKNHPNQKFPISKKEADALFDIEFLRYYNCVVKNCKNLTDNRIIALSSLCYNIGKGAFLASSVRSRLNLGDIQTAADRFLRWKFAGGKPVLLRRRQIERSIFLS